MAAPKTSSLLTRSGRKPAPGKPKAKGGDKSPAEPPVSAQPAEAGAKPEASAEKPAPAPAPAATLAAKPEPKPKKGPPPKPAVSNPKPGDIYEVLEDCHWLKGSMPCRLVAGKRLDARGFPIAEMRAQGVKLRKIDG